MGRVLPILFNTDMVRAILDGRKAVTRRVVKFPESRFTGEIPLPENVSVNKNTLRSEEVSFHEEPHYCLDVKPPYRPGDILYVRETWNFMSCIECQRENETCRKEQAGYEDRHSISEGCFLYCASHFCPERFCWHPSIHMPKEAARIWLKVTDVRAERLQEIDDNGILAEGLEIGCYFEDIWNSTIKKSDLDKYGWEANPWVWVIEFERCEKPESEG